MLPPRFGLVVESVVSLDVQGEHKSRKSMVVRDAPREYVDLCKASHVHVFHVQPIIATNDALKH